MRFCGECGSAVRPGTSFCGECGTPLAVPDGPDAPTAASPLWAPVPVPVGRTRPGGRRAARLLLAVVVSLCLAAVAGWGAHLLPLGTPSRVHATGTMLAPPPVGDTASASGSPSDGSDPATGVAQTSFVTSCGEVLDVVPVSAVSRNAAVEVALELRPVCPRGEWISSSRFFVSLTDEDGAPLALGDFDLSHHELFVPGYGDPTSRFVARFGTGTAWAAPDSMALGIANGSILVACRALDGAEGTPATDAAPPTSPVVTAEARAAGGTTGRRDTALAALRRQARADDPSVSELEGAWVPQLSSKKDGTYDDHDGRTFGLADIYQQFLALRLKYPNVRLLNSSDWQSYTYPNYWVVIAGTPYISPDQPNSWCSARRISPSQCFAKRLIRDGAPDGTTKHRG